MKKKICIILGIVFLFFIGSCIQVNAIVYDVPGTPKNLTIDNVFGQYNNLTWEAPEDTGFPAVTGYKVEYAQNYYYCSAPRSACWMVLAENTFSTDTFYSHKLTGAYSYTYRVSAINSEGVGLPSGYADVPNAPQNILAGRINLTAVGLTWSAPDDNGLPITGYKIEYRISGEENTLVENTNNTDTTYTHTDIASDQYIYYKVYAINDYGISTAVDWEQADAYDGPTVPGKPRNVQATYSHITNYSLGRSAVIITWDPPLDQGGSPITSYMIEYFKDSTDTGASNRIYSPWSELVSNIDSTNTSYNYTTAICIAKHKFRLYAINSFGMSESSDETPEMRPAPYDDFDCDGRINVQDNCPVDANPGQEDRDNDTVGDECDNCGWDYNPDQKDSDNDGRGDACKYKDIDPEPGRKQPGFEFILALMSIIFILFLKKKKK